MTRRLNALTWRMQYVGLSKMLTVDILRETVGAFRIGQVLSLAEGTRCDQAIPLAVGDVVSIEPYAEIFVTLEVVEASRGAAGKVVEIVVDRASGAMLHGRPMSDVSLRAVMRDLDAAGVREWRSADSLLYLTDHAILGVMHDSIDMVIFGDAPHIAGRTPKRITNREQVNEIIEVAAACLASGFPSASA